MTAGRNPRFNADVPMSSQTIVRSLSLSNERAGIGHLSAHDLRRTHITEALNNGAPLQDMQAPQKPFSMPNRLMLRHAVNGLTSKMTPMDTGIYASRSARQVLSSRKAIFVRNCNIVYLRRHP